MEPKIGGKSLHAPAATFKIACRRSLRANRATLVPETIQGGSFLILALLGGSLLLAGTPGWASKDCVYLPCSRQEVPSPHSHDKVDSEARTALIAEPGPGAILVVKSESVFAAAPWAGAVLVTEDFLADSEGGEDTSPVATSCFNGFHAAPLWDLDRRMFSLRIHPRRTPEGSS